MNRPRASASAPTPLAFNLLEVLYLQLPGKGMVIDAMPLRAEFRVLLSGE